MPPDSFGKAHAASQSTTQGSGEARRQRGGTAHRPVCGPSRPCPTAGPPSRYRGHSGADLSRRFLLRPVGATSRHLSWRGLRHQLDAKREPNPQERCAPIISWCSLDRPYELPHDRIPGHAVDRQPARAKGHLMGPPNKLFRATVRGCSLGDAT